MKTIKAKTPADIISVVPHILGFVPENSLVFVPIAPRDPNTPLFRVDLPGTQADVEAMLDVVIPPIARSKPDRAVLLAYTPDVTLAEIAFTAMEIVVEEAGGKVIDAVRVHDGRWFGRGDCEGVAFDASTNPASLELAVEEGSAPYASRMDLEASLVGDGTEVKRLMLEEIPKVKDAIWEDARAYLVHSGEFVHEVVSRFLTDQQPLSDLEVARLNVAMQEIHVRDVAWALLTRENRAAFVKLFTDVVRRSPHDMMVVPAAALLAFGAWFLGNGALAWCALDICEAIEPDYTLAELVTQALRGAVPPHTWQPFDFDPLAVLRGAAAKDS